MPRRVFGLPRLLGLVMVLLTIALPCPASASAPAAGHVNAPIANPWYSLRTDGAFAVWTQRDNFGNVASVQAVDLRDSRLIPIAEKLDNGIPAAELADGVVVWLDQPADGSRPARILAMDLATDQQVEVSAPASEERSVGLPVIGDGWVVWVEYGRSQSATRLMGRDIHALTPPVVLASNSTGAVSMLRMSGRRVVWVEPIYDTRTLYNPVVAWRLHTLVIGAGASATVMTVADNALPLAVALGGDIVTLDRSERRTDAQGNSLLLFRIEAHDLRTGTWRDLSPTDSVPHRILVTDGHLVVWDDVSDHENPIIVARMVDLATGSRFTPTAPVQAFANGVALWYAVGPSRPDFPAGLYTVPISALLPSAARPAPDQPGPNHQYFSETGHSLAYGFKTFWQGSGGLPVFGLPLTEEFEQLNADDGQWCTVQYLERQRFEYHPEHQGTPYETLLGRLGAEDAARREDLRGLWVFNPIPADAGHPAGCRYIEATQHRLCGEFRPYWESHGLDLDEEGVSFRESVALFGYPISEEFIDPQTGLITQYFERAVFEYHKENPAESRVLLRRLGAERLAQAGW